MLQIIKIEWLKMKHYRTFWALLLLTAVLIPGGNFMMAEVVLSVKSRTQGMLDLNAYDFPAVWQTTAFISRFMSLLLGFLLIILITNEFTFRTNRQNIIDGWERKQFLWAKLWWLIFFTLLATVLTGATAVIFGNIYGQHAFSLEGSRYLFYSMAQTAISLSVAFLISILAQRAGLSIVLYLAYVMVIEKILVTIITQTGGRWGRLLPLEAGHRLIGWPVFNRLIPDAGAYDDTVYLSMLGLYIAAILLLVARKLLRTDL